MSIQVNGNANAVNWEALLGKIGELQKTADAAGKESVTLTVRLGAENRTCSFAIPDDLEMPAAVDQVGIDSLCAKLLDGKDAFALSDADVENLRSALTKSFATVSLPAAPSSAKTVMFDLYRLMALLVEVAQKQRDASREQRLAENTRIQQSILDQAAQQRTAAIVSMATSAICCAIQIGLSGYMLGKQSTAFKTQTSTMQATGVASAKENLQITKTADTAAHASKQLADIRAEIGNHPSGVRNRTVAQQVQAGFADSNKAYSDLVNANNKVTQNTYQLKMYEVVKENRTDVLATDLPDEGPVKDAFAQRDLFNKTAKDLGLTTQELDTIIDKRDNFLHLFPAEQIKITDLQTQVPALQTLKPSAQINNNLETALDNKINGLKNEITAGTAEIEPARLAYRTALKSDLARFESEYENALHDKVGLPANASPADVRAADAKLQQASDNLTLARATAAEGLARKDNVGAPVTTAKERAFDVEAAHKHLGNAREVRNQDEKFLQATRDIQKFEAYNNIVYAVGNVCQGIIQNTNALIQAKATEKTAEQQKAREELDQTKDLFSQAQELVNDVVKLMQSVLSAESTSMRDAIQV